MLQLARRDLHALINMTDPERFDDSVFGFHAQQTVEKALKAWLSLMGVAYPKTHEIRLLFRLLEVAGVAVDESYHELADLTDFAVDYRYDLLEYVPLDRVAILHRVGQFVTLVEGIVKDIE